MNASPPAVIGRFAPSPTGPLHAGSVLAAFGSWLCARRAGGDWQVRIEDVDRPRTVAGAADAQLRTLAAFGLHADGPILRQSERGARYQQVLDGLIAAGHAFPCHCSRSDLAEDGGIHRRCVRTTGDGPPAWRLRVADGTRIAFDDAVHGRIEQDVATAVGDVVLRRADGCWTYQLAVVVDDADQGITQVVRGADLLDSTPRQILLQRLLGLPTPRYLHLPLLVDAHDRKLSKSLAAAPVDDTDPLPLLRQCWQWLGQEPAAIAHARTPATLLHAALQAFDPTRIPAGPVRVVAMHNTNAIDAS